METAQLATGAPSEAIADGAVSNLKIPIEENDSDEDDWEDDGPMMTKCRTLNSTLSIRDEFNVPTRKDLCLWLSEQDNRERMYLAGGLVRAVPASRVAAPFTELQAFRERSLGFWQAEQKLPEFATWGERALARDGKFRFVSHAWHPPEDFETEMGAGMTSYGDLKAVELCAACKDLAATEFGDSNRWREILLWVDKCCIRQDDIEQLKLSVQLIEEFIQMSSGMVVLFTWSYLSRLWCVFEWAVFLSSHEPEQMVIRSHAFTLSSSSDRMIEAVRSFGVEKCVCHDAEDGAILQEKIQTSYTSREAFERFLRFTVIALLCRALVHRLALRGGARKPTRSLEPHARPGIEKSVAGCRAEENLAEWVELAEEFGFDELTLALKEADPEAWRQAAKCEGGANAVRASCDAWFRSSIVPLLKSERDHALRKAY